MGRVHLAEIEDQAWCPRSLRDALTDYLRFALDLARPYAVIAPRLSAAVRATGATSIVDLCSGGGGPWRTLLPALREAGADVRVRLTDLYPNLAAFERLRSESGKAIDFEPASVDATQVDPGLSGFRTLFTGFHHFAPDVAFRVLRNAVEARRGIGVFEFTQRRVPDFIGALILAPLMVLLTVPLVRPFRWSRILWTYPIPILPLFAAFDGAVSCLRTYSPQDLRQLTDRLPEYDWQMGVEPVPGTPSGVTWLVGVPRA